MLIVEDDPMIMMAFDDALEELGYKVAGKAATVEAALDLVKQLEFDVAIVDVELRQRASHPVAALLRALGRPFIVTTFW